MVWLKKKDMVSYDSQIKKKRITLIISAVLLVALAMYGVAKGSTTMSAETLFSVLFGQGESAAETVIFNIRLPRVVTAMLVGALLAVSGAVMQCVLNNPLASASTLGVSQGASFGAALGIIVFGGGVVNGGSANVAVEIDNPYIVTLCALVFASLSTLVLLALSQMKKNLGAGGLVLAGVALSSLFTGGSTLLQYFADETKLTAVVFWTFGNLGSTGWQEILVLTIIFLISMVYFMLNRWNYNAMRSGADTAKSLGVNARSVMLISMAICSFTAAVAVAFVGIISFIGLIAPHIMRKFV